MIKSIDFGTSGKFSSVSFTQGTALNLYGPEPVRSECLLVEWDGDDFGDATGIMWEFFDDLPADSEEAESMLDCAALDRVDSTLRTFIPRGDGGTRWIVCELRASGDVRTPVSGVPSYVSEADAIEAVRAMFLSGGADNVSVRHQGEAVEIAAPGAEDDPLWIYPYQDGHQFGGDLPAPA